MKKTFLKLGKTDQNFVKISKKHSFLKHSVTFLNVLLHYYNEGELCDVRRDTFLVCETFIFSQFLAFGWLIRKGRSYQEGVT